MSFAGVALALAACGGAHTPDAAVDLGTDLGKLPFAAPVAATLGGQVIAHPRIAAITFAGDPMEPQIAEFNDALTKSAYFGNAGAEYGVGAIESVSHLRLADSAPLVIDDDAIQSWLVDKLTGTEELGAPMLNTLYAIYYPSGTTVSYGGQTSCGFGGYHREVSVGGERVGYAVLPRCPSDNDDPTLGSFEALTKVASHEYFEWATDPLPQSDPAWHRVAPPALAWALAFSPELADLCEGRTTHVTPADLGFVVQSLWSNQSSLAGHAPCQPAVGPQFGTAIPVLPDQLSLPDALLDENTVPDGRPVPGVVVAPGQTVTIPVRVYADGGAASWRITAVELGGAKLSLSLDRAEAMPGDELTLSLTAADDFHDVTVVILYTSGAQSSGVYAKWPLLVAPSTSL